MFPTLHNSLLGRDQGAPPPSNKLGSINAGCAHSFPSTFADKNVIYQHDLGILNPSIEDP